MAILGISEDGQRVLITALGAIRHGISSVVARMARQYRIAIVVVSLRRYSSVQTLQRQNVSLSVFTFGRIVGLVKPPEGQLADAPKRRGELITVNVQHHHQMDIAAQNGTPVVQAMVLAQVGDMHKFRHVSFAPVHPALMTL